MRAHLDELRLPCGIARKAREKRRDVARGEDLPGLHERRGIHGIGRATAPQLEVKVFDPLSVLRIGADYAERLASLDRDDLCRADALRRWLDLGDEQRVEMGVEGYGRAVIDHDGIPARRVPRG